MHTGRTSGWSVAHTSVSQSNSPTTPTHPLAAPTNPPLRQVLLDCMRAIAQEQGGKTLSQVAINWTLAKGCLPIPGAKNAKQVGSEAGSIGINKDLWFGTGKGPSQGVGAGCGAN